MAQDNKNDNFRTSLNTPPLSPTERSNYRAAIVVLALIAVSGLSYASYLRAHQKTGVTAEGQGTPSYSSQNEGGVSSPGSLSPSAGSNDSSGSSSSSSGSQP